MVKGVADQELQLALDGRLRPALAAGFQWSPAGAWSRLSVIPLRGMRLEMTAAEDSELRESSEALGSHLGSNSARAVVWPLGGP
jgi:hypothetical protein